MMPPVHSRKAWLPWTLGGLLILAATAPALNPDEQLFYRDTLRCAYHFKQFIAEQLRAGSSPFWDPWTESGTSVLVQITPGLFHPFTLLYLVLPFELAFKLNHLLAIPMGFAGLFLLARREGAAPWGAAAGACGYAVCGYMLSAVGSNLHYALGVGMLPVALHAFLRFTDRPRPLRLLWAAYALALCFYGGEPQTMLLAGFLGAVWLVGGALLRRKAVLRALGQTFAWGFCALLLAGPAVMPVVARLRNSNRGMSLTARERAHFANTPARLAGLVLPWALDFGDEPGPTSNTNTFMEYFGVDGEDAFFDSIVLGAPILLLAFASKKRWALFGAAAFALGSAGPALPVERALQLAIPGLSLFRYSEKLIAPASMLLCFAAAFGATRLAARPRPFAKGLLAFAAALAVAFAGVRLLSASLVPWLQRHGHTGDLELARSFAQALDRTLLFEAAAVAALAGVAALGARRAAFPAAAAVAAICALAGLAQTEGTLVTESLEVVHAPLKLAEELKGFAGPSERRWRIRTGEQPLLALLRVFDLRSARMIAAAQELFPMFHALAGVEGVSEYTSLEDLDYGAALYFAPSATNQILGVRFDIRSMFDMKREKALELSYRQAAFGAWVKEFPQRPRAFLAGCARPFAERIPAAQWLASSRFRIEEASVRRDLGLPCPAQPAGDAALERLSADRIEVRTNARAPALLIVAEHFDPGWRATVDGRPAEVLQADLTALSVVVPQGEHEVRLHFVPHLLWLGLLLCGGCVLGLLLLELLHRDHRVGAAEAK
jgi:hypothetical protein